LEIEDNPTVFDLIKPDFGLQRGLENADNLSVYVIYRGGEKQQRANCPACVAFRLLYSRGGRRFHNVKQIVEITNLQLMLRSALFLSPTATDKIA
jgi:hypothetical protein